MQIADCRFQNEPLERLTASKGEASGCQDAEKYSVAGDSVGGLCAGDFDCESAKGRADDSDVAAGDEAAGDKGMNLRWLKGLQVEQDLRRALKDYVEFHERLKTRTRRRTIRNNGTTWKSTLPS